MFLCFYLGAASGIGGGRCCFFHNSSAPLSSRPGIGRVATFARVAYRHTRQVFHKQTLDSDPGLPLLSCIHYSKMHAREVLVIGATARAFAPARARRRVLQGVALQRVCLRGRRPQQRV